MERELTAEEQRLRASAERYAHWKRWGPYLAERQWGTVREDYSANGDAWNYFPHDHARSRAYRWGEDGIAGFCDRHQHICFGLAMWNEKDRILKERLFGLTNAEAHLVQALGTGTTAIAYAHSRDISITTVYTHLRRTREKTGWKSVAELTRRFNELNVALRAN